MGPYVQGRLSSICSDELRSGWLYNRMRCRRHCAPDTDFAQAPDKTLEKGSALRSVSPWTVHDAMLRSSAFADQGCRVRRRKFDHAGPLGYN